MTTLNCIIVDDEPLALDLMEDNINNAPFLKLVHKCSNAYEAIEILQNEKIDLIFLDIQMPGITGLQFIQTLTYKPIIIFTTAYKQYALEGYQLDVFDYLVKPISLEKFLKSANKAYEFYLLKNKPQQTTEITSTFSAQATSEFIFVNSEYSLIKIKISDISYVEGLKDYIKIYKTKEPKPIVTRMSMKVIEEKLPIDKFIRVHKSFIISISNIESIRKNRIKIDNTEIPISDHYRDNLFKFIDVNNSNL